MKLIRNELAKVKKKRFYSLTRAEEDEIAERGSEYVGKCMYSLLVELTSQRDSTPLRLHPAYLKANSLVWIWVQMNAALVRSNILILMARKQFTTGDLAKQCRLHVTFIWKLIKLEHDKDFGGWNIDNLLLVASVLDSRPELLLMTNLAQVISNEVVNWQI
jgi:hypothetical protein